MPSISWTWTRSSLRVFLNFPVSLNGIIQPVAQPVAWRIILDPFPSLILSLTVHQQALSIYFLNSSSPPSQSKPLASHLNITSVCLIMGYPIGGLNMCLRYQQAGRHVPFPHINIQKGVKKVREKSLISALIYIWVI